LTQEAIFHQVKQLWYRQTGKHIVYVYGV